MKFKTKVRLQLLYATYCHDPFNTTMKYHDNIPKSKYLYSAQDNVYGQTDAQQANVYMVFSNKVS